MNTQHSANKGAKSDRCKRVYEKFADILFNPLRSGYQLTLDDMLDIINRISADPRCPAGPMKAWGTCLAAVFSMQRILSAIGVLGSNLQRQCKQAITCSVLDFGDDEALVIGNTFANKQFLKELLPHISRRREEWILDCRALRSAFDNGQSRNICKLYYDQHRESLAIHIIHFPLDTYPLHIMP